MASGSGDNYEENWNKNLLDEKVDDAKSNATDPELEHVVPGDSACGFNEVALKEKTSNNGSIENPCAEDAAKGMVAEPVIDFLYPQESTPRTHGLWNFCQFINGPTKPHIEGFSIDKQEEVIMEELLYVLVGMRGSLIEPNDDYEANGFPISFKICESIHPSLREMVNKILPLASYCVCVQTFIQKAQEDGAGAVLQALSSSLSDMITDYYQVIAQMEDRQLDGDLSLQTMLFIVRSVLINMEAIANPLLEIMTKNIRGGQALNVLHNAMEYTIDKDSRNFVEILLKNATVPYMRSMDAWMERGEICDPYQEFFIKDSEQSGTRNLPDPSTLDYWDKKFLLRDDCIPWFLEELAPKILRTGKYINVLFKLGKKLKTKKPCLKFIPDNKQYTSRILEYYQTAASSLVNVILTECNFLKHLNSVKHFLLLSQGDFIKAFLDECHEELSKRPHEIAELKILTLLQTILGESSLQADPHKNLLFCKFCLYDISTQVQKILNCGENVGTLALNGYQSLAFDYAAPWPISMIMNDFIINKYQLVFRLLFYIKHVENQLSKTWTKVSELEGKGYVLRYQFINTIQNFGYYITMDIIEPNWVVFMKQVDKAKDFDELLEAHNQFIDIVLQNCMISDKIHFTNGMIKICDLCLDFCKLDVIEDETVNQSEQIDLLAKDFRSALVTFLKDLRQAYPHNISKLAERIDFDNFYEKPPLAKDENKQQHNDETS